VLLRIRSDGLGLESTVVCWLNLSITKGGCELDTRTPLACRLGSPKSLTVGVVIWKAGIELISSLSCWMGFPMIGKWSLDPSASGPLNMPFSRVKFLLSCGMKDESVIEAS